MAGSSIEFPCPGCGLGCIVDTSKNTVRHQLPTCELYSKTTKLDFIERAGAGVRGSACESCKGTGRADRKVVERSDAVAIPCMTCRGTGRKRGAS